MCGRYAVFTEEENEEIREIINDLNERFKNDDVKPSFKTGEIFPTDIVPVITSDENGERVANLLKWGFPYFKNPKSAIINARCESLQEKPTFNKLLYTRRCLIPASGFYEWKPTEGTLQEEPAEKSKIKKIKKDKYLIQCRDNKLFYMAGLYNVFSDSCGINYTSFVIITTDANMEMLEIHNRMPVILDKDSQKQWMQKDFKDIEKLKQLLVPYKKDLILSKVG